jgi:hypothetical protein
MNYLPLIFLSLILLSSHSLAQAIDELSVEALVKNSPCLNNETIETVLTNKIKTGSQRDLGWQIFNEDDHFEVERAFLINKSMQLRFRWRVIVDGSITPVTKRAETLCIQE